MSAKRHELLVLELTNSYDPKVPVLSQLEPIHVSVTPQAFARMKKRQNGDGFAHNLILMHPELLDQTGHPKPGFGPLLRQDQEIAADDTAFTGNFDIFPFVDENRLKHFISGGMIPARDIAPGFDPSKLTANQCCVLKIGQSEHDPMFELAVFKAQSNVFIRVPQPYRIPGKISPFTAELAFARHLMLDSSVGAVTLFGSAGTGKTTMAINSAIELFVSGEISAIDIYKSTNQAAGQPADGALPGNADQKFSNFRKPVQDTLDRVLRDFSHSLKARSILSSPSNGGGKKGQAPSPYTDRYRQMGLPITIASPAYLRGGEFQKRAVIVEEGQNYTWKLILLVGTRIGRGSRLFVIGDSMQVDNPAVNDQTNGLSDMMRRLHNHENYGQVELTQCLREGVARMFVERYYPKKPKK
jgi:hypothetical protein